MSFQFHVLYPGTQCYRRTAMLLAEAAQKVKYSQPGTKCESRGYQKQAKLKRIFRRRVGARR